MLLSRSNLATAGLRRFTRSQRESRGWGCWKAGGVLRPGRTASSPSSITLLQACQLRQVLDRGRPV